MLVAVAAPEHATEVKDDGEVPLPASSNAPTSSPTIFSATSAATQLKLVFTENNWESELIVMMWIDIGCRVTVSTASVDRNVSQVEHPPAINRPSTVISE